MDVLVNRLDHIEFAALHLNGLEGLFRRLGFVTTQRRETPELQQHLMVQGKIRFLLSEGKPGTFAHTYATTHGEGVCSLAFASENPAETLKTAISRGAQQAAAPATTEEKVEGGDVKVTSAAIRSFGDVRATFLNRTGHWQGKELGAFDVDAPFGPGFRYTGEKPDPNASCGLLSVDHLTNNVEMGTMDKWSDFYKKVYGWIETRYFDIRAEQTGLFSRVLQSPDGGVKIPVNEAKEAKSQVQEFIDRHKGAGVQHIALTTTDIRKTVREMGKRGFKFLKMTPKYYDEVRVRLKGVNEDVASLEELDILADGDAKGYLLQIFTEDQIGPFFFEIIQRKSHAGFGEGNFKALFEAIEMDQKRRGVL